MLTSPLLSGSATGSLLLTLSADDDNVNVISKLEAIYGAGCCDGSDVVVVVTILPGVSIYSTNVAYPALDFGNFDYGASLKLVNYGNIYGAGGAGNTGNAGRAMEIDRNITINNTTTGHIYGGGGGGGQGGYGQASGHPGYSGGGGGGGGGQGYVGGAAGAGQTGLTVAGADGTAGSVSAAGTYGAGGYYSEAAIGGRGGVGGGWGQYGEYGEDGSGTRETQGAGAPGGAPGKAIYKSSACTITWTAGNNSTQVKGVVD